MLLKLLYWTWLNSLDIIWLITSTADCKQMDDMIAPQKWSQSFLIPTWWLAAVQVRNPASSMLVDRRWGKWESTCWTHVFFSKDGPFNFKWFLSHCCSSVNFSVKIGFNKLFDGRTWLTAETDLWLVEHEYLRDFTPWALSPDWLEGEVVTCCPSFYTVNDLICPQCCCRSNLERPLTIVDVIV